MARSDKLKALLRAVVLPTVGAVTLLAILLGAVLHYSTSRSDGLAVDRQSRLVAAAVRQSVAEIANDQEASTLWDDAVLRLRERPLNYEWIDNNLGIWFHTYYLHDEVYILDLANAPIYAMQSGVRAESRSFRRVSPQVLPLVTRLREELKSGSAAPLGSKAQTIGASNEAVVDGRPAIVSVKPIISETGNIAQRSGYEYLHVSVRYLDGTFLERLSSEFGIDNPSFSWSSLGGASLPVMDRAGKAIGYITWSPFEPGQQVKSRMVPAILTALILVGAFLGWLLFRVWRNRIELEASRAQAEHLAFHDPLTGLPNRALFDDRLMHALSRRRAITPTVVLLDLDRFKNVNDTLGHQAGDALIREFGARLVALVREEDTVARLGGDEFAILVEETTDSEVCLLCDRVLKAVRDPFEVLGSQVFVGVSLGVARSASSAVGDASELTRKADIALYRSKGEGRNRYTIFTEQMDASVRVRATIEEELRHALTTGEGLQVHYQPQVGGASGAIVGLEALVRWDHPTRGLIAPQQFVPVAEETGLICELGEWVLREACRVSTRWPGLFVAVNLSPVQFHSTDMVERLAAIVTETGANPVQIQLEISERVLLDDSQLVRSALRELRRCGFQIVLDDFGTGYSSLGYLQRFKVDKIKIDQSFVRYLGVGEDSSPMIIAVLALGQAMGLTVAAEGVETADQQQFLRAAGCVEMQGFLFSRAVPEADLSALLEANSSKSAVA